MVFTRRVARSGTPEWFHARQYGVSATTVAKAAAGARGYDAELQRALHPEEHVVEDNDYMRFGREQEQNIVDALPAEFAIDANDWLFHAEHAEHHLATPDGISRDGKVIAEVKTTGKDFDEGGIPAQYRRQVQWQLYVTGADYCVFAWMLRVQGPDGFVPGWLEPKYRLINRDADEILKLIKVANQFMKDYEFTKEM
jgi:predicted phage-related endonuclease